MRWPGRPCLLLGRARSPQGLPRRPGALSGHWCRRADGVVTRDGPEEAGCGLGAASTCGELGPVPSGSSASALGAGPGPHLLLLAPQLFVDKDTIVNAVGASHDIHLLKIDNREDELVTRVNSWCAHLVDKVSAAKGRRLPAAGPHAGGPPPAPGQTHTRGWSREERSQEGRLTIPA